MVEPSEEISEVLNSFTSEELEKLIWEMRLFVEDKIDMRNGHIDGIEPLDFVLSVFDKSLSGIRKWNNKEYDFKSFVFGVLKSELSAAFEKSKRRKGVKDEVEIDESYILDITVYAKEMGYNDLSFTLMDYEDQKTKYLHLLKEANASAIEILIFECWCDNIYKPQEIANFLEVDIKEIYKAIKRLERRKTKLNTQNG